MKRILKILVYALGALLLLLAAGAGFIALKGVPVYPANMTPEVANMTVSVDSSSVARGEKIASLLCIACHADEKTGNLTGHHMLDLPKEFGEIASYNITQDSVHGIGAWTDGELYYFLRTGIRSDGSWAPPFMPKFPLMADEDVKAIIAWLRSDNPRVQPDSRELPPNQYNLLVKFLSNTAFSAPSLPEKPIALPDSINTLALGEYIADGLCACFACHSADLKTINYLEPEKTAGYYGGGTPMLDMEGNTVPTANITFDPETGIGNWTREEFLQAVKYGKKRDGSPLHYPMFPHITLTDKEVNAVYDFLKTVPAIRNRVARRP